MILFFWFSIRKMHPKNARPGHLCPLPSRRHFLEHDQHWEATLADRASSARSQQVWNLFAIILCMWSSADPMNLWQKFKNSMAEDILHRWRTATDNLELTCSTQQYNEALILIEDQCLAIANKRLTDLGLDAPDRNAASINDFIVASELVCDYPETIRRRQPS